MYESDFFIESDTLMEEKTHDMQPKEFFKIISIVRLTYHSYEVRANSVAQQVREYNLKGFRCGAPCGDHNILREEREKEMRTLRKRPHAVPNTYAVISLGHKRRHF